MKSNRPSNSLPRVRKFVKLLAVKSRFTGLARAVLPSIAVLYSSQLSGCAHHPKSSATVIHEGERNPTIREAPEHAGEIIRTGR